MKKFYTLTELTEMKTLITHPVYGELKIEDDEMLIWFDPNDNIVVIEEPHPDHKGEWTCREEYTAIDVPQNTVAKVLYKLHDNEVIFIKPAYVFETPTSIYIEEAEFSTDTFRIEYNENEEKYIILVVDSEEFFINEDVTELFDVNEILAQCEAFEGVEDRTQEYLIFYIKELEREEDE